FARAFAEPPDIRRPCPPRDPEPRQNPRGELCLRRARQPARYPPDPANARANRAADRYPARGAQSKAHRGHITRREAASRSVLPNGCVALLRLTAWPPNDSGSDSPIRQQGENQFSRQLLPRDARQLPSAEPKTEK